jgi:hypothetical protein
MVPIHVTVRALTGVAGQQQQTAFKTSEPTPGALGEATQGIPVSASRTCGPAFGRGVSAKKL